MEAGKSNGSYKIQLNQGPKLLDGSVAQNARRDYFFYRVNMIVEEYQQLLGPNAIIGELGELMAESDLIAKTRLNVLKEYSRAILVMPGVDLKKIADKMIGACGPELEEVCREARRFTLRGKRVHATQKDFQMAMVKVMKDKQKNTVYERLLKANMAAAATIELEKKALVEFYSKIMNRRDALRKLSGLDYVEDLLGLMNHTEACVQFQFVYIKSRVRMLNEELKQLGNRQYASKAQKAVGESQFFVNRFISLKKRARKVNTKLKKILVVPIEGNVTAEARRAALCKGRILITQKDVEIAAMRRMGLGRSHL